MNAALAANNGNPVVVTPARRFPHASFRQLLAALGILAVAGLVAYLTVTWVTGGPSSYTGVMENRGASSLDFPNSGPVARLLVAPGQHVKAGQALATQVTDGAQTQVADDEAVLTADKNKLASLQSPQLSSAQQQQIALQVQKAQAQLQGDQTTAQAASAAAEAQVAQSQQALVDAQAVLSQDKAQFAAQCPNGVVTPPAGSDAPTLAAYEGCLRLQGQVTQDNSTVANDGADLQHAQAASQQVKDSANAQVATDQAALQIAENEQAVQTAPASPSEISAAEADVANAQAQLDRDQQALRELTLYAPSEGVIGAVGGAVGTIDGPSGIHDYSGPLNNQSGSAPSVNLFPTTGGSATSVNNAGSNSEPLFTLDSSTYVAMVQVGEGEVIKLHVGSRGEATINAIHRTVAVVVSDIVPLPVHGASTVQYDVEVDGDFPAPVLPGMSVSVVFS